MTILTLFAKASNPKQLRQVSDLLKAELGDLDLEIEVLGSPVNKWVQLALSGEDEPIATNYINQRIGTCPANIKNVKKFSVLKGFISKVDTEKQELQVDVGVFEPKITQAAIALFYLQAQLADGRKDDLKKLVDTYGFQEGLPVSIKIISLQSSQGELWRAEFSVKQLGRISRWQLSLLDRLIVLGASKAEVALVLERTGLNRDVIEVETLGLFELALTCKLGTDAAGLVSKVGRYLRNARFIVYNSKIVAGLR